MPFLLQKLLFGSCGHSPLAHPVTGTKDWDPASAFGSSGGSYGHTSVLRSLVGEQGSSWGGCVGSVKPWEERGQPEVQT